MNPLVKYGDGQIHMMQIYPVDDHLHPHAFFELVYVLGGTATHTLEKDTMPLKAGDYFIIDTGSTHCYTNTNHFEIINCLFMPEYVDRALEHTPSLSALLSSKVLRFGVLMELQAADRVFHDDNGSVKQLMRLMVQEYKEKRTGYKELLRCLLTQVLVMTVRAAEQADLPMHPATAAAIQYLRQNPAQPLCLDTLARHCGYAPPYICSLFRRDIGMTLQTYLQKLRIAQAQRLLEAGCNDLVELAHTVGYSDPKHFSLLYRRHTGHPLCRKHK